MDLCRQPNLPANPLREGESGFTLVEVIISLVIFVAMVLVLTQQVSISYTTTHRTRDRVFAYTKAAAMLAELHALVESGEEIVAKDLDTLDDGVLFNPSLSIAQESGALVPPDHPISRNIQRKGHWLWSRRIEVRPFNGIDNRNVRYVTVHVFRRDGNGVNRQVASLSSVINSVGSSFPTSQVYDVYLLAVESIPGWWVYMENIIPSVEAAITDLESRNPGLVFRTHWITKAGYGRNQLYRAHTNEAVDSRQPVDHVYHYPGKMPSGESSSYYYVPGMMKAHMLQDGAEVHGYDADTNPYPYSLSDFYNHTMRLPRARALHDLRVNAVKDRKAAILAATLAGSTPPEELDDMSEEPTLQLLLEDMATNPDKYRHALLINLHGELIPMPALRNYSDAAKAPDRFPGVRVVTHPEQIRTDRNSEDVDLRVHVWTADPTAYTGSDKLPASAPIALKIYDVNLTAGPANTLYSGVEIKSMRGGVSIGSGLPSDLDYDLQSLTDPAKPMAKKLGDTMAGPEEMYWSTVFVDPGAGQRKYTLITLYNTPVKAPYTQHSVTGNWQGLNNNTRSRLYNLEYIPSPTRDKTFDRDLSANGDGPKNTARWRIKIPKTVFSGARFVRTDGSYYDPDMDVTLTVQTLIWNFAQPDPFLIGQRYPTPIEPENLSETYTWWATTRDAVPFTERYQFCGDPRHNPYKDLLNGDPDFGDGYNWFFDSFSGSAVGAGGDYPGIVRSWNLWNGSIRQDAPRFFSLYRAALTNSGAIYTTLTGYSYYYMGHGNEIGYDSSNGYPDSIPTHLRPFGNQDSTGYVNNITGYRRYVRSASGGSTFWWGLPWLGELYPDSAYATFLATGNLSAGTGSNDFYRYRDSYCYDNSTKYRAYNTYFDRAIQRTSSRGCVSFMNNGSSNSHFNHHFSSGTATLVGPGLEMSNNYNFPLPSGVDSNRPFTLDTSGNVPLEWNYSPYDTDRYSASLLEEYYRWGSSTGSGLVQLESPSGNDAAFIVVSGLNPTTTLGSTFIAKYSLLAMLQSFFEVGNNSMTHRIEQSPRVEIKAPTDVTDLDNPTTVNVQWDIEWLRWDGQPYTATTSSMFGESESDIEYVLMYSNDSGLTWKYAQDGSGAESGAKPSAGYLLPDMTSGQETYSMSTPVGRFPQGSYILRVECYRQNQSLHYSQHQMRIFIDR